MLLLVESRRARIRAEAKFEAALRGLTIKARLTIAVAVGCAAVAAGLCAQASGNGSGQSQPAANSQTPASEQTPVRTKTQTDQNPFPEDTSSVPVIPTAPNLPAAGDDSASVRAPLPTDDEDPVRSPEEAAAAAESSQSSFSSSTAGMVNLLPPADDNTQPSRRGKKGQQVVEEHQESAAEDENVGKYYLDKKDWRAALSRFQSALVLDPENPDVYWGLAESQRHLGDFAGARGNYLKVIEYDPDSRHAKEARKALKEPEMANAKPPASSQASVPAQP